MSQCQLAERTIAGLHEFLIKSMPQISHDVAILDVGCGTGAWLERISKAGYNHLYGIDFDTAQFAATQAICTQIDLNQNNWNLGNQKFGLITAIEVIEHLENTGIFLRNISTHLTEKGYFLLTTPNVQSLHCRLRYFLTGRLGQFDHKGDPTHIAPILVNLLEVILPRYNLHIVKRFTYPTDGSLIYQNVIKLLALLCAIFIRNPYPGDVLCLLIQKK